MGNFSKKNIFLFLLLSLIITPIALIKLNAFSIRLWDESMFSVNSYEMMERNEFIVPYYNGEMNLWNSKPPLLLWTQMASIKLFGYNELAIRFPSAIAAAVCVLLLFFFLKKHINLTFAWVAALILITAQGFFTFHTGRTGDSDALLTLIITAANLFFIDTMIENKNSNIRLIIFFILLTLGFLCKSVAAFLFSFGYLTIVYLNRKSNNKFLAKPGFWLGFIILLSISTGYVFLRNHLQPGYINFIFSVDIGRIASSIENHKEPFLYYIENLSIYNFRFWFVFLLVGIIFLLNKNMENKTHTILLYVFILSISYFIIISLSVSKLPWYTMPLYPLFSIIAAIPIYQILLLLDLRKNLQIAVIVFIFIYPYKYVYGLSQSNPYSPFEEINEAGERYIFTEINENKYIDSSYILHSGFQTALKFYEYKLKEKKQTLFITDKVQFPDNAIVIVPVDSLKRQLKNKYNCFLIDSSINVCKYKIMHR